jgi:hypothetical protein
LFPEPPPEPGAALHPMTAVITAAKSKTDAEGTITDRIFLDIVLLLHKIFME